jgi:hypothetical protein
MHSSFHEEKLDTEIERRPVDDVFTHCSIRWNDDVVAEFASSHLPLSGYSGSH